MSIFAPFGSIFLKFSGIRGTNPWTPHYYPYFLKKEGEHPPQSPVCTGVFKGKCGNPHMAPDWYKFARFGSIFSKFTPPGPPLLPLFFRQRAAIRAPTLKGVFRENCGKFPPPIWVKICSIEINILLNFLTSSPGQTPRTSIIRRIYFSMRASMPYTQRFIYVFRGNWGKSLLPYGTRDVQICSIWINISKIF